MDCTGSRAFQPALARRQAPAARRCDCEAEMQFIKGLPEPCVPDIGLTRSKDGSNGVGALQIVTGCTSMCYGLHLPVHARACYELSQRMPSVSCKHASISNDLPV